ncbi:MAG: DUF4438 domain-containing protein [Candidatus Bathyarchaeota archaeon]|nr:DUF4438 domain-containing protein [Candidatus Bathyarchaeota archaeon]
MLKLNTEKLIKISVMGEIASPTIRNVYSISPTGAPTVMTSVGGITYNLRVGDPACGWMADHAEPCVSLENKENDARFGSAANTAFNVLSCVGNEAIVASGDAKGERGVVTGKHGGVEHVMVDFSEQIVEKLLPGDRVLIKAFGTGLKLLDFPEIKVMNMDPKFLEALNPLADGETLEVSVAHVIPAAIMGSGLGATQVNSGDYDIQLSDEVMVEKYSLASLRIGDIVAIVDADHSFGRIYRQGAMSIGIVVHSNCVAAGHGPGVTTLMTSSSGKISPKLNQAANIASLLKLRAHI